MEKMSEQIKQLLNMPIYPTNYNKNKNFDKYFNIFELEVSST